MAGFAGYHAVTDSDGGYHWEADAAPVTPEQTAAANAAAAVPPPPLSQDLQNRIAADARDNGGQREEPAGWDVQNWGSYWSWPQTFAAKQASGQPPNLNDYIAQAQYDYVNRPGATDFEILNRPYTWDKDAQSFGQNSVIAPYNAALAAFNAAHGTNYTSPVTSASQLPNTGYQASLPAENKASGSFGGLVKGVFTDTGGIGAGLAALGGGAALGLVGSGTGAAAGADSAIASGAGNAALAGGTAGDAALGTDLAANTVGGMSIPGGVDPITGAVSGPMSSTGAIASGAGQAAPFVGAAAGGAAGSTLGDLLNNVPQTPPLPPSNNSANPGGSTTTAPTGTDANGNLTDANGTPFGPPSSSTAGGTVPDSTTTPGTASSAATSALQRIINGTATAQDWISAAGALGTAGVGVLGSDLSRSANNAAADKMLALGAPARDAYNATLQPGYDPTTMPGYTGAIDSVMNSYLRKASTGGNPFSNPGVSSDALKYVTDSTALPALNTYRSSLTAEGGIGVANANAPNVAAANSVNSGVNSVAGGLASLTAPNATAPFDYASLAKQLVNLGQGVT